jgi:hypothetical protein
VTPAREAFGLPLTLLTVVLLGGVRLTTPLAIVPPTVFSLVLASVVTAVFVQSGALDPSRLVQVGRPPLANLNGLLALAALFLANAQIISRLTPDTGLPALAVNVLLLVTLLQLAAAALDRQRCLRVWGITLLCAFAVKFVIVAALAGPADRTSARVLQALVDGLTFGNFSQPAERPAAGYLAFAMLALYLLGVILLPAVHSYALPARHAHQAGERRQEIGGGR